MREILFRGKCILTGKWHYGSLAKDYWDAFILGGPLVGFLGERILNGAALKVIPETIGEYTGLNDKNGTRIFEGDIVEAHGRRMQIVMDRAMWKMKTLQGNLSWAWVNADKSEVIGNIYDNPELLEGDEDE